MNIEKTETPFKSINYTEKDYSSNKKEIPLGLSGDLSKKNEPKLPTKNIFKGKLENENSMHIEEVHDDNSMNTTNSIFTQVKRNLMF